MKEIGICVKCAGVAVRSESGGGTAHATLQAKITRATATEWCLPVHSGQAKEIATVRLLRNGGWRHDPGRAVE